MKKRMVCLLLAVVISSMQIVSVSASREEELRQEREDTSGQLDATYSKIDALQAEKAALDEEIGQLDQELVNVMISVNVLKKDISAKEEKIDETQAKLTKAETKRDQQYEAMKTRIQYIYENPVDTAWVQVLESGGLSEMLSKAEYTQQMYGYDQASLDKYVETVEKVTDLGNQLAAEKAELEDMKAEQEKQQANLEEAISQKEVASEDYSAEISNAQAQADAYAALLEEQTAEIARLEEERLAAEEEARRQAEAEAAAAAAAAQAAQEEEAFQDSDNEDADVYGSPSEGSQDEEYEDSDSYDEPQTDEYGNVIDEENTVDETPSYQEEEPSYSSGSGQAVVDYATQFVGNPYVWGGTSLTNGADCSGFVQSVYAHFGVSLPRTSESQMYAGRSVSYSEAQPGDLICYGSHIAIYMGGGQIVHASNSAPYPAGGIKISSNAAYRTILDVRRVI